MEGRKKVCIIGAGVSGLISAKVLLDDKDVFDITVYEKSNDFGGVWSHSRAYSNLCTNNAKYTFSFADLPIPDHYDEYPTAAQMLEYFTNYASKFDLLKHISFNTTVVKATELNQGVEEKWEITTSTGGIETTSVFDYLIVATGLFETPYSPTFDHSSSFKGRIYHSSGLVDHNIVKNQRVLVVGNGKSAADMVSMCGEYAKDTLMVFRKPHWLVPRYIGGLFSTRHVFYGRWYRYIMPYHNLGPIERFIQTFLSLPIKAFWKFNQFGTIQDMKVPKNSPLIPDCALNSDPSLGVAPPGYYESMHAGKVRVDKTEIARFVPNTNIVEFTNGKSEEFDVVVFATGYSQSFPFFDARTCEKFQIPTFGQSGRTMDSPFRLYKSVVPIKGPTNIGFVGFQNCICNCTLYEAQAHWLTEYFLGHVTLPNEEEREKDVTRYLAYEKRAYTRGGGTGCFVFLSYLHMLEGYLTDMKVSTTRTGNFLREYLLPVYPQRYSISKEKRAARTTKRTTHPRHFSFSLFVILIVGSAYLWRYFARKFMLH